MLYRRSLTLKHSNKNKLKMKHAFFIPMTRVLCCTEHWALLLCCSFCSLAFLEEIYKDISSFGLKSLNAKVVGNSSLAISWLEITFPDLANRPIDEANVSVSRAQPYAPPDASLSLQVCFFNL